MRDRFTRVLKGHIAIASAIFPKGATGAQLDAFARRALWDAGLDYDHGTGHGVGAFLSVHEGPQNISKRPSCALEPGMILSNEPGYYKTGAYGIRIENLVLVEKRDIKGGERESYGFETLTLVPSISIASSRSFSHAMNCAGLTLITRACGARFRRWCHKRHGAGSCRRPSRSREAEPPP